MQCPVAGSVYRRYSRNILKHIFMSITCQTKRCVIYNVVSTHISLFYKPVVNHWNKDLNPKLWVYFCLAFFIWPVKIVESVLAFVKSVWHYNVSCYENRWSFDSKAASNWGTPFLKTFKWLAILVSGDVCIVSPNCCLVPLCSTGSSRWYANEAIFQNGPITLRCFNGTNIFFSKQEQTGL